MTVTVIVTGVGGGGVGRQVLKSLRHAGRYHEWYRIIGTDATPISMGLSEADVGVIVPRATEEAYIPTMLRLCAEYGARVIIPGSEPELQVLAGNRLALARENVLLLANTDQCIATCMDKWKTYLHSREAGFGMPESWLPSKEPESWPPYGETSPMVIKPTVASGGSLNVYVAQEFRETKFFVDYLQRQGLVPMIQRYVGTPEQEYTVGVLTDPRDGGMMWSIAVKRYILSGLSSRIRTKDRDKKGSEELLVISSGISQGEVDDYPEVRHECERIALGMESRGPMNFQVRVVDGKVYVFEINPRFSGTTYIRTLLGFNDPVALIRRALFNDRSQRPPEVYPKGRVLRGLDEKYVPD